MRSHTVLSASLALAILACTSEQAPTYPSASTSSPAATRAGPLKQDFVKGTAEHIGADPPFPVIQARINARSDATGADPKGFIASEVPSLGTRLRSRVTCLSVRGNEATIGIEIVKSSDPSLEGKGQLISVIDGSPDRIAGFPPTSTPPTVCPALFFNVPVISGDYVIHDASP
ncbi:MAG: hypothetical protein ACREOC_07455 [Gemmatimonadales bacterium]